MSLSPAQVSWCFHQPALHATPVIIKRMGSTMDEKTGDKKQQTAAMWACVGGYFAVWPQNILHWWLRPLCPRLGRRGWRNGSGAASHCALPSPNWPVCFAISDSCLSWGGLFFTPLNEVLLY